MHTSFIGYCLCVLDRGPARQEHLVYPAQMSRLADVPIFDRLSGCWLSQSPPRVGNQREPCLFEKLDCPYLCQSRFFENFREKESRGYTPAKLDKGVIRDKTVMLRNPKYTLHESSSEY